MEAVDVHVRRINHNSRSLVSRVDQVSSAKFTCYSCTLTLSRSLSVQISRRHSTLVRYAQWSSPQQKLSLCLSMVRILYYYYHDTVHAHLEDEPSYAHACMFHQCLLFSMLLWWLSLSCDVTCMSCDHVYISLQTSGTRNMCCSCWTVSRDHQKRTRKSRCQTPSSTWYSPSISILKVRERERDGMRDVEARERMCVWEGEKRCLVDLMVSWSSMYVYTVVNRILRMIQFNVRNSVPGIFMNPTYGKVTACNYFLVNPT